MAMGEENNNCYSVPLFTTEETLKEEKRESKKALNRCGWEFISGKVTHILVSQKCKPDFR